MLGENGNMVWDDTASYNFGAQTRLNRYLVTYLPVSGKCIHKHTEDKRFKVHSSQERILELRVHNIGDRVTENQCSVTPKLASALYFMNKMYGQNGTDSFVECFLFGTHMHVWLNICVFFIIIFYMIPAVVVFNCILYSAV